MSHRAFTMLTESGVLRPGNLEIRRGPGGVPLYASRQVSDFLNHSVDVLFGPERKPDQQKMSKEVSWPKAVKTTPSSARSFRLRGILIRLGLLDQADGHARPELPSTQPPVTQPETLIQKLESLLKAEQTICQAQREELMKLRAQANRIDVLEAELAIERELGTRLVHWLQEAEQELAGLRRSSKV